MKELKGTEVLYHRVEEDMSIKTYKCFVAAIKRGVGITIDYIDVPKDCRNKEGHAVCLNKSEYKHLSDPKPSYDETFNMYVEHIKEGNIHPGDIIKQNTYGGILSPCAFK